MLTSADFALNWIMCPEDNGNLGAHVGAFVLSYPCSTVRSITLTTVNSAIERGYRLVKGCNYEAVSLRGTRYVNRTHCFLKVAKSAEDLVNLDSI